MTLLIDTHVLLWVLSDPEQLAQDCREALVDEHNEVFVSAASVWEVAIKHHLGRLRLPGPLASWLPAAIADAGISMLDTTAEHACATDRLPDHHRDPFDRMLVAQARVERMRLVTRDKTIAKYPVETLRA